MQTVIFFKTLYQKIFNHAESIAYPYVLYGWFQTISNPIFYLIWVYFDHQSYESLGIRIGINLLCLPLALKDYWPARWQYYLPLYWYFTAIYTLPFFFTFMLLKNDFSNSWVLAALTGVVLCILLLDLIVLFILLPLGIAIAWIYVYLSSGKLIVLATNHRTILITYACVIIFGALFTHRKEKIQQEKLEAMKLLSANMAHELRTPLVAINASNAGLKEYFPDLIKTYEIAKEKNLSIPHIRASQFHNLNEALDHIEAETKYANTIINMILINVDQSKIKFKNIEICSISQCIQDALSRYPFLPEEKNFIDWKANDDFFFKGDQLLMIHVLFNLLKNALFHIKVKENKKIKIWIEKGVKFNKLHFYDTGAGIPASILPRIFDRFFTKTYHGSGVGLAFCKMVMESNDGAIACNSIEGEYTEFVLSFPAVLNAVNQK